MKRFICLMLICLALITPATVRASEKSDCEAAAQEMMDTIVSWRRSDDTAFLLDPDMAGPYIDVFGAAAEQLTERISFKLGNGKATGNTAVVDISISAVDVGQAAGKLLVQSAGYAAVEKLRGNTPDLDSFMGERLVEVIGELPTITTHTSMYLLRGGDGDWKLDLGDERNLDFLNALGGGGIIVWIDALQSLAYG